MSRYQRIVASLERSSTARQLQKLSLKSSPFEPRNCAKVETGRSPSSPFGHTGGHGCRSWQGRQAATPEPHSHGGSHFGEAGTTFQSPACCSFDSDPHLNDVVEYGLRIEQIDSLKLDLEVASALEQCMTVAAAEVPLRIAPQFEHVKAGPHDEL